VRRLPLLPMTSTPSMLWVRIADFWDFLSNFCTKFLGSHPNFSDAQKKNSYSKSNQLAQQKGTGDNLAQPKDIGKFISPSSTPRSGGYEAQHSYEAHHEEPGQEQHYHQSYGQEQNYEEQPAQEGYGKFGGAGYCTTADN
jgi:hypothetical protein